jgi:hydrogenase maturation protease
VGPKVLMEGRQRVIFVDAANMGQEPGQVIRFALEEVLLAGDDRPLNVHSAGLRDALLLARALGTLPSDVVVYGVQPASIEWDSTLSQEVEAVLPDLVEAVLTEVTISTK